jgi:hypothetical protein
MKQATPTHWWRKRITAGQVGRNDNSGTTGRYNTNKEDTNTQFGQVNDT